MMVYVNPKKIIRRVVPKTVVKSLESTYRKSRGVAWQARYGFPARSRKVIAVTGTNGKTTTASYINSVLLEAGLKTAVYTTAYFEIGGTRTSNTTHMTVASQRSVQQFFARAKKARVDWVILEVTSNALHQGRIAGLKPNIGVITNLTQDHLDYHGTMEEYAKAKLLLFTKYGAKTAVLNHDDEWYDFFSHHVIQKQLRSRPKITSPSDQLFADKTAPDSVRRTKGTPPSPEAVLSSKSSVQSDEVISGRLLSFGEHKAADLVLSDITTSASGSIFNVRIKGEKTGFSTSLLGKFNIYNALCAISVGTILGLTAEDIANGVARLKAVPGRMEEIDQGQDFSVLVDFAYTPDALLNALTTLRPLTSGKLRIVFGATGDRDASKRPLMGEVVADHADAIYLTDDETYTENPKNIRDAVYQGIVAKNGQKKTEFFDDRLEAIKQAFKDARGGDTVLLAGIGHEDYRNMGGKKLPWDERHIARELLKS